MVAFHSKNPSSQTGGIRPRAQALPQNILVCSPPSLVAGTFFSLKMNLDALYGYQVTVSYKAVFESVVPGSRGRTRPQFSPSLFASWLAVSSWHEAGVTERDGRAFLMGVYG